MVSMLREIGSPEIGEYIMKSYFDVATNGTGRSEEHTSELQSH